MVAGVKAGLGRARSQGKPLVRPMLSDAKQQRVRDLLAAGTGIVKTAHIVGCGVSVVQRLKAKPAPALWNELWRGASLSACRSLRT